MKRTLALLLTLALLMSMVCPSAVPHADAAAEYTIRLADADGNSVITAEPGDTVVLSLSIENNPGILSVGTLLEYPSQLSLTKAELPANDMINMYMNGKFMPNFYNSSSLEVNPYLVWMIQATGTTENKLVTYNGKIHELTFQIAEDAAAGDYTIKLSAPADKNATAAVDDSGVILSGTNATVSNVALADFTVRIGSQEEPAGDYTVRLADADGNSAVTAEPGDTLALSLSIENNPGIISVGAQIKYPGQLSLTKAGLPDADLESMITNGKFTPSFTNSQSLTDNPYLVWLNQATGTTENKLVTYNGKLQELTFKIAEDAIAGDYTITVAVPTDKNLTAQTDKSGVIVPNTNVPLGDITLVNFTVTVVTSGTCGDDLNWSLDENGTLTISGAGAMQDYVFDGAPWYTCRSRIKEVVIADGVTAIGDNAFYDCDSLTAVTIPDSITAIGDHAFAWCTDLSKVTIPGGVTAIGDSAFYNCHSLTAVTIPSGVETISDRTFAYCYALTQVTVPDSVTAIGTAAFYSCDSLTDVYYSAGEAAWGRLRIAAGNTALDHATVHTVETLIASGTCGESLSWTLNGDGVLKIVGTGAMTNYSSGSKLPWYDYRLDIIDVIIGNGVTTIGNYAFSGCDAVSVVSIPDSVTQIGERAFYGCYSLESITIPDGVTGIPNRAFFKCTSLESVVLGSDITTIDTYAFYNCSALTNIHMGEQIETIGDYAFYGCSALTELYYAGTLEDWEQVVIGKGNTTLPEVIAKPTLNAIEISNAPAKTVYLQGEELDLSGMTVVGIYSDGTTAVINEGYTVSGFDSETTGTKTITVTYEGFTATFDVVVWVASGTCGDDLTWTLDDAGTLTISGTGAMDNYAYNAMPWYGNRDQIKEVVIGDSVTAIGEYAFHYCRSLTTVTIGNSVTTIGDYAFSDCAQLPSVVIPDSVTTIGKWTFAGCNSLTTVTIPYSVTTIGESSFGVCGRLTSIWVEDDNTAYSSDANGVLFNKDKTELIQAPGAISGSYTIPDSVTTIGDGAFQYCIQLTSVTISVSVTYIGNYAFYYCSSLTSMTIPDSVTTIGDYAFYYCDSLTDVYYAGTMAQWNAVSIGNGNEPLTNANLHTAEPELIGIAIDSLPEKTEYVMGESLDITGLTLTATYDDGTTVVITEGYTVSGFDSATTGTYTVTVTYEEFTATFDVTVLLGGTCGNNLTWTMDENGALTVTGTGAMKNYSTSNPAPWFDYREKITKVVLEEGVTTVGLYAFNDCTNLTDVSLPTGITGIYGHAFAGCTSLTSVYIPNTITTISNLAFKDCKSLSGIWVEEGAKSYSSDEFGILFNKAKTRLLMAPGGISGHYTIPDSVTAIAARAFMDHTGLTSVTIGTGLKTVEKIAFAGCTGLADVYYAGTLAQWNTISIAENNDPLTNATLHTVEPELTYILINTLPEKTEYLTGESIDVTGLTLMATYADGSTAIITEGYTVTEIDSENAGTQTISVTYGELTVTFDVTVLLGGTCGDDLTWVLDEEGVLTISGTGEMDNYSYNTMPWYGNGNQIKEVVIGDSVTTIGDYAFYDCTSITDVTIPDSIITIGDHAFSNCHNLTMVTIPDSVATIGDYAFDSCDRLTSVTIPDSVTTIGDSAFQCCSSLTDVTIPDSVTIIGDFAFVCCTSLTELTIPDSVAAIGDHAFEGCDSLTSVTIPVSVTTIGDSVFGYCDSLTDVYYTGTRAQWNEITISDGNEPLTNATLHTVEPELAGIAINALPEKTEYFMGERLDVTGLTLTATYVDGSEAEITEGFTVTGFDSATAGTQTLIVTYEGFTATFNVTVLIGSSCGDNLTWNLDANGVLTISGAGAMYDYAYNAMPWYESRDQIKEVVIADGVTSIGAFAFSGCESLTTVSIPDSVITIGDDAFSDCISLNSVVMGNGVTTVGNYAFYGCYSLADLTLGDSITTIGDMAFYCCESLTEVILPGSVTAIGQWAFAYCNGLTNVEIPNGITTIDRWTFAYCHSLASVTIPDSVTTIDYRAFDNCYSLTDVYYTASAAQWEAVTVNGGNAYLTRAKLHTVEPVVLIGIEVESLPAKIQYLIGEELDITGLTLRALYSDGTAEVITENFAVAGFDSETAGTKTLTAYYKDFTTTFDVEVAENQVEIISHPVDAQVTAGFTAEFAVEAINAVEYKWQYRRNEDAPWVETTLPGNKTATLSVLSLECRDAYQYRCRVTGKDGKVLYTEPATLTVLDSIVITSQPARQIVDVNANATFTVEAEGEGLTYQWLYRKNDEDFWKQTGLTGNKTPTLTVSALVTRNGYQYMCAITDENGIKVNSKVAVLSAIGFTAQPEDQVVAVGTDAVFAATAKGQNLTYQWMYRKSETGSWMTTSLPGAKTDTLTVNAIAGRNGYQYCCRITDELGTILYSDPATLIIE